MTVMPGPEQLEAIGRVIVMCNHIEELARHIAVLPLERRTNLELSDLLLGSRGTKQAQQFLASTAASIRGVSLALDLPMRWLKEADAAIERRNDLLHRPVGLRISASPGQGQTIDASQLRLRRSRQRHEIEDLGQQYQDLLARLEGIWERGRSVRTHFANALSSDMSSNS